MNVDQVYRVIKLAVSKNLQQGYVSPADFYVAINQAQRGYLDYLKGEYQRYQTQRPIAPVEFGENAMIRQSLAPLIYGAVLPINSSTGIAAFPNDLEYTDAMWGTTSFYNIRFIQQDRLAFYMSDPIDPIAQNPVYLLKHEGFQFYPVSLGAARISYLRTPPSIVWASIPDSNGIPQYDPANSQQPVWAETDMMEIIARALVILGCSLESPLIMQYANDIKNNGQ